MCEFGGRQSVTYKRGVQQDLIRLINVSDNRCWKGFAKGGVSEFFSVKSRQCQMVYKSKIPTNFIKSAVCLASYH
jgi:hypothetical protein